MLTSRQRVRFCLLKYVSRTSLCWRSLSSFHLLYSYYLHWAWSRLATSMPMPQKWLQLKSLAISHHCRSVAVVCQAIIKKYTRSGGHMGVEAVTCWKDARGPGRTAELPVCGHGPNATHAEQFMREANWFLSPSYYKSGYNVCRNVQSELYLWWWTGDRKHVLLWKAVCDRVVLFSCLLLMTQPVAY